MRLSAFALALASVVFCAPAIAQERVTVKSGQEGRVGWIGSVGQNCQVNDPPVVKPSTLAKHGQIKLVKAQVKTNTVKNCPGVTIPAIVIYYTSAPSFKGVDEFALISGEGKPEIKYVMTVE